MRLEKYTKEEWATFSEKAHSVVFGKIKESERDRFDFVLLLVNSVDQPVGYTAFMELDSKSLYLQWAGVFPSYRSKGMALELFQECLKGVRDLYETIVCVIESENIAAIKTALDTGFRITGTRNYKGRVLVEHTYYIREPMGVVKRFELKTSFKDEGFKQ